MSDLTLLETRADTRPRAPSTARAHPGSSVATPLLLSTLVVASVVMAWTLAHHPMWFDEMQAWNIARSSGSLADLVHRLRYEGHPVGWYLPLYAASRFTGDPRAMQVLEFSVVVATFALVLFRSPFPYLYRAGLVASYFVFFEYGAISRSYSLAVLLLVALLCVLDRKAPRWILASVLSCALAFTVLSGAVLALAIAGAVFLERPSERGRRVYTAVTVVAVGVSAASCVPPSDFRTFAQGLGDTSQFGEGSAVRLLSSFAGFWRAVVPVPDASRAWNTNVLDGGSSAVILQAAAGVAVFFLVFQLLRGARMARHLWCIGSFGFVLFSLVVILPERYRYAGTAFLLLVACVWLAWRANVARRPLALFFGIVLCVQVVATLLLLPLGASVGFSPDHGFAEAVRRGAPGAPIVSGADFDALTAAGYLDQPVYSVARGAWTRYFVHDERQASGAARLHQSRVLCEASTLAERRDGPVVAFVVLSKLPAGTRRLARDHGVSVVRIDPGVDGLICPA